MLNLAWKLIKPLLTFWGVMVNPYVILWGEHYVQGSQKPLDLPCELHKLTKAQVLVELCGRAGFDPITHWGCARWLPYKGSQCWYTHPTLGVVGGFIYKLISYEDKFVIKCIDKWDFNTNQSYKIPLPSGVHIPTVKKILKKAGLSLSADFNDQEGYYYFGLDEQSLSKFNDKHEFYTYWELELPVGMKCPINSPLKKIWAREQIKSRKSNSYFSK